MSTFGQPIPSRTVMVFGAGFTKAYLPDAPMMIDTYDADGALADKFKSHGYASRLLNLEKGRGSPSCSVWAEAGNFGTTRGTLSAQGEAKHFAYAFSASGLSTENNRPDNQASLQNYAVRLDYQANANLAVLNLFARLRSGETTQDAFHILFVLFRRQAGEQRPPAVRLVEIPGLQYGS